MPQPKSFLECESHDACEIQFGFIKSEIADLKAKYEEIRKELNLHGQSIATLRAQVTMAGALGALAGAALANVVTRLLGH